ncbi:MAG: energy transducer TonB [Deltaproteobacteria bacterium]|nr:energy transducer TonB [Deltaproteobacteria bacterium]
MNHAAPMPRLSRRAQAKLDRAARAARANARVKRPVPEAIRARDPITHASKNPGGLWVVLILIGAVVAHAVVLGVLWTAGLAIRTFQDKLPDPKDQRIEVSVVEPPPPPPPPPEAPPPPPPEPEPEVEKPKPKPQPKPKAEPPPPDPIDTPKEPPPPPPPDAPKPRRIVGLSLESTVQGGDGPAFGVGNTRMGETSRQAADPTEAKPLPKVAAPDKPPPRVNRVATRVPTEECKLKPPLPKGPRLEPAYPKDYEAQELASQVVLEVRIGADGQVMSARIVKDSPYPKFNENALSTIKKQRFTPATCDGEAREYVISYTYTFELPK